MEIFDFYVNFLLIYFSYYTTFKLRKQYARGKIYMDGWKVGFME